VCCLDAARTHRAAPQRRRPPCLPYPFARKQAERSPEAAAFIEMYELAAEAKAFKDSRPAGAGQTEWERFWTGCFLRLARCYLHVPMALEGGASILGLEGEALTHLLTLCRLAYGNGITLRGDAQEMSDALGRLLEEHGLDLSLLARLAVGLQTHYSLAPELYISVIEALQQPGVRARVQAQLAAAQAGVPPARRLTYGQLELLFAKAFTLKGPDSPAAQRCVQRGLEVA
jgi:hypothetical protein